MSGACEQGCEAAERERAPHGSGFPPFPVVEQHPIVDPILGLANALEGLGEELTQEVVVGGLLEAELSRVV